MGGGERLFPHDRTLPEGYEVAELVQSPAASQFRIVKKGS